EAKLDLSLAWEILGGKPCSGICGYVPDTAIFDTNSGYNNIIEKKAENMYRTISQKMASFPASNKAVTQTVAINKNINLTPKESEQLSQYAADESYVQTQKEDIKELASYFQGMLSKDENEDEHMIEAFREHFSPQPGLKAVYKIVIEGKSLPLYISVDKTQLECIFKDTEKQDVLITTDKNTMSEIINGRMTFQRAFMSAGTMKVKGDFTLMRSLDQLFVFMKG
ncbi:MAG: SCP2 sterol-binding domain-containing protein, partial [Lachnospiraceae bacterium]